MVNVLLSVLVLAGLCLHHGQARQITPAQVRARQQMAAEARRATLLDLAPGPVQLAPSHIESKRANGPKNITFSNPKASGTCIIHSQSLPSRLEFSICRL